MKKVFLALMAVAAIALTGCEKNRLDDDLIPPENAHKQLEMSVEIECSCGSKYKFEVWGFDIIYFGAPSDYKVYASGSSVDNVLYYGQENYPFVAYHETELYEVYYFWRCRCGRYHKVKLVDYFHYPEEIPSGQQPSDWNLFNYLWE